MRTMSGVVVVGVVNAKPPTAPGAAPVVRQQTVDAEVQRTVIALAVKHNAQDVVDLVSVPHTMAAIEACNEWIHAQMCTVNQGAPLPLGSGIGRKGAGLGVRLRLPKNATKRQRDFAETAQQRCGDMLQVKPGHVLAEPLACTGTVCDPPLPTITAAHNCSRG